MKLGINFFVIQIAYLAQLETSLFLISHYFGPAEVANYNIALKYFSVLQMCFMIILSPLWSGVTDAYSSGDIAWIKNAIKKYMIILIPFITIGLVMLLISDKVYELWVGKNIVHVGFNISLLCFIFFATGMFASIFVFITNGIGALQIQFFTAIIASISFFALSLLLIKHFQLGVQSVIISSIVTNIFGYIIAPVQVYNILYKQSKVRIWYR